MTDDSEMLSRWRLILGSFAEENIPIDGDSENIDGTLSFLYDREYSESRGLSPEGGRGASVFTVPEWIGKVRKLFPKKASDIMQKEALHKYGIEELLTDPKVLEEIEPDINLLGKLLSFKNIIPKQIRELADRVIRETVMEIQKKLESEIRKNFSGKRTSSEAYAPKIYKNFDFKKTVKANLKYYSKAHSSIVPRKLYFYGRIKRYNPWEVIILVDESGSMADSVIYSAVTAAVFAKLPFMKVRLAAFDTSVTDLSDYTDSAADILMKVQLGGGTDILKAVSFAEGKITTPAKTIVILITDLYEGGDIRRLYAKCGEILEGGSKLFVITALDYNCTPVYNRPAAKVLADMGASVGAVTPEGLAEWIANIIL